MEEPKVALWEEVVAILPDLLKIVMRNWKISSNECIRKHDRHLNDTIFKT